MTPKPTADVRPLCPSCGSSGQILTVDWRTYVPCDHPLCAWTAAPVRDRPNPLSSLPVLHVPAGSYPATVSWSAEKQDTSPHREPAGGYDVMPVPERTPADEIVQWLQSDEAFVLVCQEQGDGVAEDRDVLRAAATVLRKRFGSMAPMPTLEEILAREPGKYLTETYELANPPINNRIGGPHDVTVQPPMGWCYYVPKTLLVWPPSPDLRIERINIGSFACLDSPGMESVACWRSPIDMSDAPAFSNLALSVPLSVRLDMRRPIARVVVIVTGEAVSTLPEKRSPYGRRPW